MGMVFALAIILGDPIYNFFKTIIPTDWLYFGELSIPIYLIILFAFVGYFIDKH